MNKLTKQRQEEISKKISPVAIAQRKELIGFTPIDSSIDVLEKLGYIIVKFPCKDKNLSGFCIKKSNYNCIYVNTNTTLGRQHFSMWHEYYHLYTGDGIGISLENKRVYKESEFKAHEFASNFLMPINMIEEYIKQNSINLKYIKNIQIAQMANYFKVSYIAMLYRLVKVFPVEGKDLSKRFKNAQDNEKVNEVYSNAKLENKYDSITNDIYITKSFFDLIDENYKSGRIPEERLDYINELLSNIEDTYNE
ncbi:MAG: ImmA/IrrE family metallo-endopeptidase [Clostridium sp.]|uniref:ImmA/IrrE family metallo-endopeptidase n=1 Tax=Clostridium sp. TaxID=1506 RepID=UPI002FC6A0A7